MNGIEKRLNQITDYLEIQAGTPIFPYILPKKAANNKDLWLEEFIGQLIIEDTEEKEEAKKDQAKEGGEKTQVRDINIVLIGSYRFCS